MTRNLLICMILCLPWMCLAQIGNTILLTTDSKDILMVAGSDRGEHYAYVTSDGLTTVYNNTKTIHNQVSYSLQSQNYTLQLKDNIKDISCDADGRIYLNTKDDHIIMFERGKVFAGLPLRSSDFHLNFEGYVCTNFFFDNNWYVAELLENPTHFDDMFTSSYYPDIQNVLNMLKPDQLSINEQELSVVTGENKRDIAYPWETKIIWHKANESYIPCDEIVDISSSRASFIGISGLHYQIYTVCKSGEVWVWTRRTNTNNDMKPKFTEAEWKKLDFSGVSTGQIKSITHVDRNFLIAHSNSNQNGTIIYNVQKKIACSIDLPGATPIQDFFFSPYEILAFVAMGKNIYTIDIDADQCKEGISGTLDSTENNWTIHPNPSTGDLRIICSDANATIKSIRITDMQGRVCFEAKPEVTSSEVTLETALHPGMYFVQIYDQNHRTSSHKLIIH